MNPNNSQSGHDILFCFKLASGTVLLAHRKTIYGFGMYINMRILNKLQLKHWP